MTGGGRAAWEAAGRESDYGPWFPAGFGSDCDGCGSEILDGDQIRSDGEGGWLCEDCGGEDG